MGSITYITGGARSGKSSLAVEICSNKKACFIATCQPLDKEMKKRIEKHKADRPKAWSTIDAPYNLIKALKTVPKGTQYVIIDCLTLYVSNLLCSKKSPEYILNDISETVKIIKNLVFSVIIVSNELGSGIVPVNKLARDFRDIAGKVNQLVAKNSNKAYLMVSGLKVKLK